MTGAGVTLTLYGARLDSRTAVLETAVAVDLLVGTDSGVTLTLHVPASARDELGYPARIIRQALPTPGYTRHTIGDREAARDTRRARRRSRPVGTFTGYRDEPCDCMSPFLVRPTQHAGVRICATCRGRLDGTSGA